MCPHKLISLTFQRIQAQIEENRKANAAAYEAFIKSHTPLEIREANTARRALFRLDKGRRAALVDDRLVRKPLSSYVLFVESRLKTGEHGAGVEPFRIYSREWSQLPPSKKEVRPLEDTPVQNSKQNLGIREIGRRGAISVRSRA